jgi:RNA polymerase sigma-70 factor (ECF subfamily)
MFSREFVKIWHSTVVSMRKRVPDSDIRSERTRTPVHEAYLRHELSLKRFIRRFMRASPDVEDIAQETFLRAYTVERGRSIEQPKSLLFRIAKHVALSRLTRKSTQITEYIEDLDDSTVITAGHSAEEELSAQQILGLHCDAVAQLAPKCREAYLLRKVHGLSHKEIAARMGIAVSTVEKHLIKGLEECDRYVRERTEVSRDDARTSASRGQARGGR